MLNHYPICGATFSRGESLLENIKRRSVRRKGVDWPASNEMWTTALSDVI